MLFRKDVLSVYLKHFLTDEREWNDTFLQYLSQIGRMYTNKVGSLLLAFFSFFKK